METVPRPVVFNVVRIDLRTPGLRFLVTPPAQNGDRPLRAQTTSRFLTKTGAQIAINGDFFYPFHADSPLDYYPHTGDAVTIQGRACSAGNWYADGKERRKLPALFLTRSNRAFIGITPPDDFGPFNVVSGSSLPLQKGKPTVQPSPDLQPRTAVGLDKAGRFLWLLVADGRQKNYSEGATEAEVAQFLQKRGAWTVLTLDGGGSATLVAQKGKTARVLNRPIHVRIPGRERPVANHLAVFVR